MANCIEYLKTLIGLLCVLVMLCIVNNIIPLIELMNLSSIGIGTIPEWLMLLTAIATLFYSSIEYRLHKKRARLDTFAKYSERYSSDKNITAVVEYLIAYMENYDIAKIDLSINNKEMFLRFFEELELQMENGAIYKSDVDDFFVYYAVAASMCKPFLEGTDLLDNEKDIWKRYRKLISRYKNMEVCINNEYKKHHDPSDNIKILIDYPIYHCCYEKLCNSNN